MIDPIFAAEDRTPVFVIAVYLLLLMGLGFWSKRRFSGTSSDYFVASRSIGPFLLLMSVFGTTMTAFALVGSTGEAFQSGVGVYGLMASSSGLIHSLVFFLVGMKLWAIGKRHGFVTQVQYFRARLHSNAFGYLLFPVLVALVIPYLLIGVVGAGSTVRGITAGMFPELFSGVLNPTTGRIMWEGAVPPWLTGLVVCGVVLFYISLGGLRGAAIANAAQTIVFMSTGVIAFWLISQKLGGVHAASEAVAKNAPNHLTREGMMGKAQFMSYLLVPLSVGMFPHLFQHWLTAKSAKAFRLSIIAHPIFIMIVWVPCVLLGVWAAGQGIKPPGGNPNVVLSLMVSQLLHDPWLTGLITAGVLAAIMSSLDSQFVCLGTMFTHDIVVHATGKRFSDRQQLLIGRSFIVAVVAITYGLAQLSPPSIFDLAVWCFSAFAGLFPLVFAAVYWRRLTTAGAIASLVAVIATWAPLFYKGLIVPVREGHRTGTDYLIFGMMPVAVIFAASTIALVVVSLLTTPPPAKIVEQFFVPRGTKSST